MRRPLNRLLCWARLGQQFSPFWLFYQPALPFSVSGHRWRPCRAHKAFSSFSVRGRRVCAWSAVLKRKSKGGFRMTQTGASFVMASFFFVLLKYSWFIYTAVNSCYAAKWLSYTQVYPFSFSLPWWFVIGYWIWFPELYSGTWLFIHPQSNSSHLLIPDSTLHPTPRPLGNHRFVPSVCESNSFLREESKSLTIFFL